MKFLLIILATFTASIAALHAQDSATLAADLQAADAVSGTPTLYLTLRGWMDPRGRHD